MSQKPINALRPVDTEPCPLTEVYSYLLDITGQVDPQLHGIIGVPYRVRISITNQRTRNEVGHFAFRSFPHVFGMSVPPIRTLEKPPVAACVRKTAFGTRTALCTATTHFLRSPRAQRQGRFQRP